VRVWLVAGELLDELGELDGAGAPNMPPPMSGTVGSIQLRSQLVKGTGAFSTRAAGAWRNTSIATRTRAPRRRPFTG
jgi:hypothetical protein